MDYGAETKNSITNNCSLFIKTIADDLGRKFLLDRIGICLLLFLSFAVGFSRGLANTTFALLFLVFLLRLLPWSQAKGGVYSLPKPYLWSQLVFALTWSFLVIISPDSLPGAKFLLTVLYLMAIFPITVLWVQEERFRRLILPLLAMGFIVASLIASYQAWPAMACIRAKAHLGVIEYGGILGLLSFFWAALSFMVWQEKKYLLAGLYFLAFWAGIWGQTLNCTRISLLETLVGAIIFFALCIRRFNWRFFLIIILSLSLFFLYSSQRPEMAAKLASISNTKTDVSNTMRLAMWAYGWKTFKEHPFLGIGIENLPEPMFSVSGGEIIWLDPSDRQHGHHQNASQDIMVPQKDQKKIKIITHSHVHNVFLNIMAQGGIVGLLSYLALYFPFIILAFRRLKSSDIRIRSWSVLTLVLIGEYFMHSMTDQIFSLKPLMYVFWMLMGLAYLQMQPDMQAHSTVTEETQAIKIHMPG